MSERAGSSPERRWPVWRLALLLYPFAAGAVAINAFLLGLLAGAFDMPALSPLVAGLVGLALGVPAAWWAGARTRALIDEADPPGSSGRDDRHH